MRYATSSVLAVGFIAALAAMAPAAQADTVTATLGATGFTAVPVTLGTFNFAIPAGQTATSATVAISNLTVAFAFSGTFYLDGVSLGDAPFGVDENPTFDVSDLSVLDDGSATLTFSATDYFAGNQSISTSGETLTINTTSVPEPTTMTLLGIALVGLGAIRRRPS